MEFAVFTRDEVTAKSAQKVAKTFVDHLDNVSNVLIPGMGKVNRAEVFMTPNDDRSTGMKQFC